MLRLKNPGQFEAVDGEGEFLNLFPFIFSFLLDHEELFLQVPGLGFK